tara:strand:- start:416 stop:1135 length:720 start_codon:yes stop_codon:yes gene_type:complete
MISKQKIKFINSLKHNKYRLKYNCFVAEGVNVINEFIQARFEIQDVFATKGTQLLYEDLHIISKNDLKKISFLKNPSNSLAIFKKPIIDFDIKQEKLTIMLDGVSDPGNIGTIIRTADWFRVENIYISENSCDPYSPKVVQATMGSLARVNVHRTSLKLLLKRIRNKNIICYGATLSGESVFKLIKPDCCALVFGNETHGISDDVLKLIDKELSVPAKNECVDSLNVAVAFGIILSEFR